MELVSNIVTFFSIALLYGIPLAVIAVVLYGAYRCFAPVERKLPEDLPNELFDGTAANAEATAANEAATSEFKKSFGASARKRFATMIGRFNAYFFIQKNY